MRDTSWIKPQLDSLFSGRVLDAFLQCSVKEKIDMFGGKLYKYYSFAPNDSNYSINNFENNIIYFSLPKKFNDPFDCVMGISLDEMTCSFLMSVLDNKISVTDKNSELIKSAVSGLLVEEVDEIEDPTVKLIILLLKQKRFREIIERAQKDENAFQAEFAGFIAKSLCDPDFLASFIPFFQIQAQQ